MEESDCIVLQGSNMAEGHPVAFRWPMVAKSRGAKIIHVDPRFTRTSAMADIYAPIRAGSDIAFLGGLINFVVNHQRWSSDAFFRQFLVTYTNAATIITDTFKDTDDLDGVFSGLMQYDEKSKEWPYNGFLGQYDNKTWQYAGTEIEQRGWTANTQQSAEQAVGDRDVSQRGADAGQATAKGSEDKPLPGPPFEPLVKALLKPPPRRDPSLKHPGTVFQVVKRHFARYTPEMVEQTTGCPKDTFLKVAETILANSGRDRTTSFAYAVAWTQHTNGPQVIGACALLQLLLGNVGRPGAGIMALRGHASIQGSTDIPTLYHSIHGYMAHPSSMKKHATLAEWLATETVPTGSGDESAERLARYVARLSAALTGVSSGRLSRRSGMFVCHKHIEVRVFHARSLPRAMTTLARSALISRPVHPCRLGPSPTPPSRSVSSRSP